MPRASAPGRVDGERLPLRHAIALGAIQGPAELLPISSSGHLVLIPRLCGWRYTELDAELRKSFEVALHAGTAAALLVGLRREVADYLHNFGWQNVATLTLSFAPAALVALRFERAIESRLSEIRPVCVGLIAGSLGMALADERPQERKREDATVTDALVIGAAQALALLPGVSRNGATLTAARWLCFKRADANVISRQIALPVIVGAATLKGARLARRKVPRSVIRGMVAGSATAFVSTVVSMRLIAMLERSRSLLPYAAYRVALATIALRLQTRHLDRPSSRVAQPVRVPTAVQ